MTPEVQLDLSTMTQRQKDFCLRYFETRHATQSAIDAGYSAHTAYVMGSRLLDNVKIQARLAELNQAAQDASVSTVLERRQRLTRIERESESDHDVIRAIDIHNKTAGVYTDSPPVYIDNRTFNITVASPEGESMTKRLIAGEGTEK